jgi:hypothetical protein
MTRPKNRSRRTGTTPRLSRPGPPVPPEATDRPCRPADDPRAATADAARASAASLYARVFEEYSDAKYAGQGHLFIG